MASVNTRADVTTRVRPEAQEREATQGLRGNQSVEVSDRSGQQAVNVEPVSQAPRHMREASNQVTPVSQSSSASMVPQVSSDAVVSQRQAPQTQQQAVASRQIEARNAQASGFAASPSAPSRRIPTLDISDIGRLETQSARPAGPAALQAMNASLDELADVSLSDRGITAYSPPIASDSGRRLLDQRILSSRSQEGMTSDSNAQTTMTDAIASDMQVERASERHDTGRPDTEMNKPSGWRQASREPRLRQPSQRRHSSVAESEKRRAARSFNNEGVGYRIYGKVNGYANLDMHDVGVGSAEVFAAVQQDPSMITKLLSKYSDDVPDLSSLNVTEISKFINSEDIWVATFKPPDNRSQDAQSRRLRVLEDHARGIYLNPIMAAMYTADFDGDDMTISFDPDVEQMVLNPMEQLVDIFGDQTLNTDFLYVARIYDMPDMSARDYVRIRMLSSISQADWRTVTPLIDAILRLGETEGNEKQQAAAWGEVFRQAREVSNRLARHSIERSNLIMSRIVKGVYDGMYELYTSRILDPLTKSALSMPDPVSYEDQALYEVLDGIVAGEAPNNFQDLKVMLTGYLGEVIGKNASFRFTADVGKVTKMDTRLQIGNGDFVVDPNDSSQMQSLFETTMKYAYSHRMAVEYKKAGHSAYYTQIIKERVISEVGMPEAHESYKDFIDAFVESYMTASSVINQANMSLDSSMRIVGNPTSVSILKSSNGGMTASDIAGPLIDVYGVYSIGRMFPHLAESGIMTGEVDPRWKGKPGHVTNLRRRGGDVSKAYEREYEDSVTEFFVTNRYSQWSLRKFAHENRLLRQRVDAKISSLESMDDAHAELAIMLAIADKRTGTASKFNEKTYGIERRDGSIDYSSTTVGMTSKLLDDIAKDDGTDRTLWVDDAIDALIASNPDMFHHFDMDSPAGFRASTFAQKMLDAHHDMDVLGGIRLAMVAEWRMERITALNEQLSSVPHDSMQLYATVWNNLQLAKDELAASSEVWHGIMRELEMEDTPGEKSVFQMMREDGTLFKTSISNERYEWTADGKEDAYYARSFWQRMGDNDTLLSVIQDTSMGIKEKTAIIADVVRYWENDFYLKSYEVGFQMEVGNDSAYSLGSQGQKGALTTYREFEQAFNHWGKVCQDRLQDDVNRAAKKFRNRKGALMHTLSYLSSHPEVLIDIDDNMYADAIMSSFDKTYAQTEKAKQNPWTNTAYQALSTQIVGGLMNDVERTNDRLVGCQPAQSVGVLEIIRILADPNESIEVYDGYGRISDPITRDDLIRSLLGHEPSLDVESDIWDIMVQNPRLASAIRMHSMSSLSNMDGKAYLGASYSIAETIEKSTSGYADPIKRTKFLLRDFPGYPALISLATPAYGAVTRTHRGRIMQTEQYLSYQIASAATTDCDPASAAEQILADLGITFESLSDVMMSDYDRYCQQLGLPVIKGSIEETDADAGMIWESVKDDLTNFIEVVRNDLPQGILLGEMPQKSSRSGIDISSVASYWDVMQEFNGAKTAESTSVEGGETHRWAEWITHIRPRDNFANLKAVMSDVDQSWNGLWTSEGQLSIGDDGTVSIDGRPVSSFDDEVVTEVPDGYRVRDKSTSRHAPVPSLFAYAVSKRSNGAETFNLKAKKSGRDQTNSVIKVNGRYRQNVDPNTGNTYRSSFSDMRDALQETLDSEGLRAAQLQMARLILQENQSIGYEDLTLSNYMCIAELMVRETEDGRVILRTLPMLFDAIKNRIGTESDNLSDKQLTKAVQAVVNDVSDNAVGLSKLDASLAFDGFTPRSKSASVNGIRPHSSSFERNYSLLSDIERDAMHDGVLAIYEQEAVQLTEKYVGIVDGNKRIGGVPGVVNVFSRVNAARDYKVVGYAGAYDRRSSIRRTIGPLNAIVIGDGQLADGELQEICDDAYKYGMTVIVSGLHLSEIPAEYASDAIPCSDWGDAIIPMFDMRLNGSEATPYNGGRFAIYQVDPSRFVLSVEDPLNYFKLGDAQYKPTEHFANRVHNIENGSQPVSAEDLFPNVFQNPDFANCDMSVSLASGRTISRLIANGVKCTIDYGMVPGGNGWDQRVHDVDAAIQRYQQRWNSTDNDGTMVTGIQDCQPGDIVAWAECGIIDNLTGRESYVLAPIIPFPLHGSKRGPETFSVEQVATVNDDNTMFAIDWTNTSKVIDGNAKYFDSSGGANKGIMDFVDVIKNIANRPLTMRDGTPVDNYVAKASTDSRKIGTDRRVKTMITLMTLARLHGYNFAESDISFPENPDIKERLRHERILTDEWRRLMAGDGIRFSSDRNIDAFLRFECQKILDDGGNPSDYLAESYTDENGNVRHTRMMWEFEAMFERGIEYENQLLRFLHSMDPTFCPDGLDDANEYLFRLKPNAKDFDRGVLEMECPYPRDDGNVAYSWANVYIGMSFFGEDYSGFSRPNVSGASNFMDAMNTYSYYGLRLDERRARFRKMWATNDMGRMPDGGAIGRA